MPKARRSVMVKSAAAIAESMRLQSAPESMRNE